MNQLMHSWGLAGFIFEQEYLTKQDGPSGADMAAALDKFFQQIPQDNRYHLELGTELYLRDPVLRCWISIVWVKSSHIGPGCRP